MKFVIAKKTLEIESDAVSDQIKHLDSNFEKAIYFIHNCAGRVVIMGLGKSGLIGRKISATMSSVGIPSTFLHSSDGLHGDIGMLIKNDIVIMLSYSGGTEEIRKIFYILKKMKIKVIAMTGKIESQIWQDCDCVINCSVDREACHYGFVPTSSTIAMLAMGDALALTVSNLKGFTKENLAMLHPLGIIGKRLTMKVSDIMRKGERNPVIECTTKVKDALFVMTNTKVGATSVVNSYGRIVGFFTDGDLRRSLQKNNKILDENIANVMTKHPKVISPEIMATDAIKILKMYNIDNIPVVDRKQKLLGILDLGDLLSEGIL
ncbi:MAG: KpsF/GutQ family sugar-phosphate isomerase [Endomicrobium sp.]|jgi:arabinose-5-phosphate isomerase|nr:KpsF/GutQ family sugar-phosphate isomerase [Endomicrobium sp.]